MIEQCLFFLNPQTTTYSLHSKYKYTVRLCPLIPFHGLNYLGGITNVSWKTFLISLLGILPYQILIIIMGATAETLHSTAVEEANDDYDSYSDQQQQPQDDLNQHHNTQQLGLLIVTSFGIATLVIAMVLAFRFTKKELQKVSTNRFH